MSLCRQFQTKMIHSMHSVREPGYCLVTKSILQDPFVILGSIHSLAFSSGLFHLRLLENMTDRFPHMPDFAWISHALPLNCGSMVDALSHHL